MKYSLDGTRVITHGDDFWIAPNAVVVGNVRLGRNASVWWNCVVRGDFEAITVGENTNVQDGSVLHADPGLPLVIGDNVLVGHKVVLHGCTIGDHSLIGIGSIVLNGARIGRNCLIAANTLILEAKEIPDNCVVMGSPGKVVREVTTAEIASTAEGVAHYVENWRRYKTGLRADD